jgi:acyl-CoA thioesterase I
MNICIFGDSITEGIDDACGGWVGRLDLNRNDAYTINLGVDGDTTDDLVLRFEADVEGKDPDIIVIAIGTNDSMYLSDEDRNYVDLEKFIANLGMLKKMAEQHANRVAFVGLTPADERLTTPVSWGTGMLYINREIERYDRAIRAFCEKEAAQFIDIHDDFMKLEYMDMLADGLHPNALGYEWMAKKIAMALQSGACR